MFKFGHSKIKIKIVMTVLTCIARLMELKIANIMTARYWVCQAKLILAVHETDRLPKRLHFSTCSTDSWGSL